MAVFNWTLTGTSDWTTPGNWNLLLGTPNPGTPPPGSGDFAFFGDAGAAYTVNVTTTVDVGQIEINPTTSTASFAISGSLTTGALTFDTAQPISMTVDAGGLLHVTDALDSLGSSLETIAISGTGAGGHVELGNFFGVSSNVAFAFDNSPASLNTGVIQFDNVILSIDSVFRSLITNVAQGDEFVVTGVDFTGDTVNYAAGVLTVADRRGDTQFEINNLSATPGTTFVLGSDTIEAVCYARGTMIQTPAGELPVETLRPGMQVITILVDGGEEVPRTVKWVGHRRIDLARHPRPEAIAPIRIERDAFDDNMPHTDLLLSPDHAVFVDGILICIRQLVNGSTIRIEPGLTAIDYYHVELDKHAILVAEGLPAESYLDTGNRGFFANSGAPMVLHPDLTDETDYPTREVGSCAPFASDEANVRPVWQHLADRAAAIGQPVTQRATTADASLRLLADQRTVKPVFSDSDRVIFVLPRGAREVRLLSRAQSPTEARPWLEDRRQLGVRVKRIVLRGADELREVPMDHPDVARGWWAVERDGQIMSRWTDGEAVLPLPAMCGPVMLEFHLAGSMTYAVHATKDGTERRAACL